MKQEERQCNKQVEESDQTVKDHLMLQYSVMSHFCRHYYSAISAKQDKGKNFKARGKRILTTAKTTNHTTKANASLIV